MVFRTFGTAKANGANGAQVQEGKDLAMGRYGWEDTRKTIKKTQETAVFSVLLSVKVCL